MVVAALAEIKMRFYWQSISYRVAELNSHYGFHVEVLLKMDEEKQNRPKGRIWASLQKLMSSLLKAFESDKFRADFL